VSMSYAQAERLLEMAKRNCKKCDYPNCFCERCERKES
jgi:hypothetical protein